MSRSRWIAAVLIVIIVAIPILFFTWRPFDHQPIANGTLTENSVTDTGALTEAHREVHLFKVNGTLAQGAPVNYLRSDQFIPKTNQLKIVLTLRANQQINATIEVVRIIGYCVYETREGPSETRIFGVYPETFMNRTHWDFHRDFSKTEYVPLYSLSPEEIGRTPLGLEIQIFLEGPNYGSNPTFLVFWQVDVYDVYVT